MNDQVFGGLFKPESLDGFLEMSTSGAKELVLPGEELGSEELAQAVGDGDVGHDVEAKIEKRLIDTRHRLAGDALGFIRELSLKELLDGVGMDAFIFDKRGGRMKMGCLFGIKRFDDVVEQEDEKLVRVLVDQRAKKGVDVSELDKEGQMMVPTLEVSRS